MNWDSLKSFQTVARTSSFTKAAEQLMLTQPAVSRQIRQLEQTLGVVLFDRLGHRVELTDAGQELARLSQELLAQADRVVESVRRYGSGVHGRLRIGASTTPGYYMLPSILGRFRRTHPSVELQFKVDNSQAIERDVLHNELDLGLVGVEPEKGALLVEAIADDEIVCFGAADHPLGRRKRVPLGSLEDSTWVVRERGSATRQLFERWLHSTGSEMRRMIELHSPEAIKALVRTGVGVSFMSIHGLKDELRYGHVIRINVGGLRLRRKIYLLLHPDKHISPVLRGFLELCKAGAW